MEIAFFVLLSDDSVWVPFVILVLMSDTVFGTKGFGVVCNSCFVLFKLLRLENAEDLSCLVDDGTAIVVMGLNNIVDASWFSNVIIVSVDVLLMPTDGLSVVVLVFISVDPVGISFVPFATNCEGYEEKPKKL